MRIRHVLNVVGSSARADLREIQHLTLETIDLARRIVPDDITVEVAGVRFDDEEQPAPWLDDRWTLSRSVLDVGTFERRMRLPLRSDVFAPFRDDGYDLGVFTNIDIAVQPRFYELLAEIHREGYDAFVINRRTVQPRPTGPTSSVWLSHQVGAPHPGHDCFVFTPEIAASAPPDDVCLGIPFVMRSLLWHLMLASKRFRDFTTLHATFHVGDDRSWTDPALADFRAHNVASMRRALQHLVDTHGRDAVAALPATAKHLRALDGEDVRPREWTRRYAQALRPRSFSQQRLIFAASPGRSGSQYLAQLLDTVPSVRARHEPEPKMIGPALRDIAFGSASESYPRRIVKADALRAALASLPNGGTYAETSHMFLKTFADVVFDEFNHDMITIVRLHRPIEHLVASMESLGWFTPATSAWRDWILPPTAPGAMFRLPEHQIRSNLDMIIGYVLDTELRANTLRTATPDVRWVDLDPSHLADPDGLQRLFEQIELPLGPRTRAQASRRVNERIDRKKFVGSGASAGDIAEAIDSFRHRFDALISAAGLADVFEHLPRTPRDQP